jgi:SAM-dependent methyltransferase
MPLPVPSAVSPDSRLQSEIAHGRRIAEHADDVWGWGRPTSPRRADRRANLICRYAHLETGTSALELGCGTGFITQRLAGSGAEIVAIELSPDLLRGAERRGLPANVRLVRGNAEALDFPSAHFDAVVGSSVLHHLDIDRALGEIHRVLRPGGRIAFSEPNMLNPHILAQKNIGWLKRLAGDTPDETAFVRWPTAARLARAGFCDIHIQPYDFLHPIVPTVLIPPARCLGQALERIPFVREIAGSLIIAATRA